MNTGDLTAQNGVLYEKREAQRPGFVVCHAVALENYNCDGSKIVADYDTSLFGNPA